VITENIRTKNCSFISSVIEKSSYKKHLKMEPKIFKLLIILLANIIAFYCQNEDLACSYSNSDAHGYTCILIISNLNGFNSFTTINGIHEAGKSDKDVQSIIGSPMSNTTNIPSIICEKFKNIQSIDLTEVEIQIIDENSFKYCQNLSSLRLNGNKIKKIDENSFINNLKLSHLYIFGDQSSTLPDKFLTNQTKLEIVYVFDNQVADLTNKVFNSIKNLNSNQRCDRGHVNERLCDMEDEMKEIQKNFENIQDDNDRLNMLVEELQNDIKDITAVMKEMQNQILELSSRPCACK